MTMFSSMLRALALAAPLCWSAAAAAESLDGAKAVNLIRDRIAAKDCSGAVDELKAGLKRHAEVALLAGGMYENGLCVRRDWDRAVSFYTLAFEGGLPEGASRLAAGFAAPENGPDVAAALWWASRGKGQSAQMQANAGCVASPAAADDADRFVAELQTWPQARLLTCNYIAGVMSTLSSEVKYPEMALRVGISGEVIVRFQPAVPRFDFFPGEVGEYRSPVPFNDKRASLSLGKAFREVTERALRRYPQPAGIPAGTEVLVKYNFLINQLR